MVTSWSPCGHKMVTFLAIENLLVTYMVTKTLVIIQFTLNNNNNNKPQEVNKINCSSNQKSKKIPIPKQNQISTKSKSRNQPKKRKNYSTIPKNLKQSKKCKLNPTQIKKKNPSTNTVIPWLKWENNSCRYDSFLCLFTFNIYHNPTPTYIRKN